jgi:outer membrane protein assembly factor BamD
MQRILIFLILTLFLNLSCSKKEEIVNNTPSEKDQAFTLYEEALASMDENDYFYASKKFSEAEGILPKIEFSAKASIMSSYCLYIINFYDEALEGLERFILKYPADQNIPYAHYLIAISYYEQILDAEKDIKPLLLSKKKIDEFIINYPDTDYAIDLKYKQDLIYNQLAAKELSVAKYYMNSQKWIPAINRLQIIVKEYNETIFIEEALHRLVEVYYKVGLEEEAKNAAILLGYNYNSSVWYEKSYKILNKKYKIKKIKKNKKKDSGIVKRTINKIIGK